MQNIFKFSTHDRLPSSSSTVSPSSFNVFHLSSSFRFSSRLPGLRHSDSSPRYFTSPRPGSLSSPHPLVLFYCFVVFWWYLLLHPVPFSASLWYSSCRGLFPSSPLFRFALLVPWVLLLFSWSQSLSLTIFTILIGDQSVLDVHRCGSFQEEK